jgi:hypothetical protein
MTDLPALTHADFAAAAARAGTRPTAELFAEAGMPAGPQRWMLQVGGVRLPLRLFVALALRQRGSAARPGTAEATALAEAAGLEPYDGHLAESPLRTG